MSLMDKLDKRAGVTIINLVQMYNDLSKEPELHEKYGSISLKATDYDPRGDLTLPTFVYEKNGMFEELEFEAGTIKMRSQYNDMAIDYNKLHTQDRAETEVRMVLKMSEIEQQKGWGLGRPMKVYIDSAFGYGSYTTGLEITFDAPLEDGRCPATITLMQEENLGTNPPIMPKALKEYEVDDIFDKRELESVIQKCSDETTLAFGDYRMGRDMSTMARAQHVPPVVAEVGFFELPDDIDEIDFEAIAQEQDRYSSYGMPTIEDQYLPDETAQYVEQEDSVL